jgi:hypothetical protein
VAFSIASLLAPGSADAGGLLPSAAWPPRTAILNELRVDQPGTDNDEYIELLIPPGQTLAGLSVVVIGDDVGLSGCIEEIVDLEGVPVPPSGVVLVAQPQMSLAKPDLVMPLELENSDNLTVLLVSGFTGALGQDLDLDDDGALDLMPWVSLLDAVSLVENIERPPVNTEWWYALPVGPGDNGDPPYSIRRCPGDGTWQVSPNDPAWIASGGKESPGALNPECEPWVDCPADFNGDGIVDPGDLAILLLSWGYELPRPSTASEILSMPQRGAQGAVAGAILPPGGPEELVGHPAADLNGDGVVGAADLGLLLEAWQECSAVEPLTRRAPTAGSGALRSPRGGATRPRIHRGPPCATVAEAMQRAGSRERSKGVRDGVGGDRDSAAERATGAPRWRERTRGRGSGV